MSDIFSLVAPFFGLILLGYGAAYLLGRRTTGPAEAVKPGLEGMAWLNAYILYLALPSLFFTLISRTPIQELTRFDFILTDVAATYSIFTLLFVVARFVRRTSLAEATVQGLAGAYGNIGYMGPGLALMALGERAAVPVALIFSVENVAHFITAPAMMAIAGSEKQTAARLALSVVRKILLHPFILATAIGVAAAAFQLQPPVAIRRLIEALAPTAAPCALFAMGVTLGLRPLRRVPVELTYIVPVKLLLHPAVMYLGMSAAGHFEPVWVQAAVLLAALPTATNVFVIAEQYGVWQERASAAILITTALSMLSVTGLLYLIGSGGVPADLFP
ncbi:AEC family transporter [Rhizobium sp. Leaf341]|uniref:AEC family transporter n=1 Tax=Rhizobium sp. Leaf341 TaxID=1736344 RepID=UPI000712A4A8|nr:AEC family transporter [Rhizobium sp. Leaf341]KQR68704.1 malonate transporter [Rhizobium sp. Leaf341]